MHRPHYGARPPAARSLLVARLAMVIASLLVGACSAPQQGESFKLMSHYGDRGANRPVPSPVELPSRQADPIGLTASVSGLEEVVVRANSPEPETHQLTFEQALDQTLQHPLLRVRRHEVEVARAALISARLLPNPEWVMDVEAPVNELTEPVEMGTRVMFTIPGAKWWREQDVAKAGIQVAAAAVDVQALELLQESAAAGLEVLYIQESQRIQQELRRLAEMAAEFQRGRLAAGAGTEIESLVAEVQASEVEFNRIQLGTQLQAAQVRLARAMGVPAHWGIELQGTLPYEAVGDLPLDVLVDKVRAVRPELAAARANVVQSKKQVKLARAEAIPDLQLGVIYQDDLGEENDTAGGRIQTDLPIFDRNQGGIYESKAQLLANRANVEAVEIESLADVVSAYNQLLAAEESIEYYEQQVQPRIQRAEELIESLNLEQLGDPAEFFIQLRRLSRTRLDYLQLRYLHAQLRVQLELLLGCRLSDLTGGQPYPMPEELPTPAGQEPTAEEPAAEEPERLRPPRGGQPRLEELFPEDEEAE